MTSDIEQPDHPDAFLARGLARLDRKELAGALEDLEAALRLDPAHPRVHFARGRVRMSLQDYPSAIDDFDEALRRQQEPGSETATILGFRATARHYQDDHHQAIVDFDQAIALRPTLGWLYNGRGSALDALEDCRAAIADYTRAIDLDPKSAEPRRNRGQAYTTENDHESAIVDFNEAIRLTPEVPILYHLRAYARHAVEDLAGALEDFGEVLRLDPNFEPAYWGRARTFEALGRSAEAEADHERFAQIQEERATGDSNMFDRKPQIDRLIQTHFEPTTPEELTITQRNFPLRVRSDLQRAIDRTFGGEATIHFFCGVRKRHDFQGIDLTELLIKDRHDPAQAVPPMFEEVDIGDDEPVRCLKNGLWLLEASGVRFVVFLEQQGRNCGGEGLRIQVATTNEPSGFQAVQKFFKQLEDAVKRGESYRGKILSLERKDQYSGQSSGINVHKLAQVDRDQVILPARTLQLLERNVIRFVGLRAKLNGLRLATKKGLLFYGPPGTGKTHTIHYLAGALPDHTTLLITSEQVALLDEYMTLARLFQPSIVVIEDVDLIARDRTTMDSPFEEAMLNKLLNEMDGLRPDSEILFILTTNRPEALEAALASRPGRVDQAIEFPLPDDQGRTKLIKLYARDLELPEDIVQEVVRRTEGVSASFIKELMRRSAQFLLEREEAGALTLQDVEPALEELIFTGGSLNRKLLGGRAEEP